MSVVAHRAERHDARIEPRIADVGDAAHPLAFFAGCLAFDDDTVDPRTVRRIACEIAPAFDRSFFQFGKGTHHFEVRWIFFVNPNGQGEPPESLLADHPVAHVGQPFDLPFLSVNAVRQPLDLSCDILDLIPPVHVDEPFIDEAENEFIARAPAMRIDVRIRFDRDQHAFGFEFFKDEFSRGRSDGFKPSEVAELCGVRAIVLQRRNDRQSECDAHLVVDVSTARRDMDDACPFARDDIGTAARVTTAVDDAMTIYAATTEIVFIDRHAA